MAESSEKLSWRARWSSIAVRQNIAALYNETNLGSDFSRHLIPAVPQSLYDESDADAPLKVCIVGAGIAGLFTAALLDYLKQNYNLEVEYEILEAADETRFGGRLYSYYFGGPPDKEADYSNHQYFDIGAMRFPVVPIMDRTFELFETLGMTMRDEKWCEKNKPKLGELRRYYFTGPNTTMTFNDIQVKSSQLDKGNYEVFNTTGNIPEDLQKKGPGAVLDEALFEFTKHFKGYTDEKGVKHPPNIEYGWKNLMEVGDKYSVRQYLAEKHNFSYDTIEWLETFNSGDRWYDQALSEAVIESLDFDANAKWWCIEGGANQLAIRTRESLTNKNCISYNSRVTKMALYNINRVTKEKGIELTYIDSQGKPRHKEYSAVFNSVPLGAMSRMDLAGLNLNYGTKQAIRSLGYGASCKVGIKFKDLWWRKDPVNIGKGGISKTDLPLRTCVYPSYNINDDVDAEGVLLVSYCWSQDAQRLSSLIDRKSPENEELLIETLIHDLAKMHAQQSDDAATHERYFKEMYDIIKGSYITHFAYDWYQDPHTSGAFAFFGPGQFRNMYPFIERNDGRHIIIGEAASGNHAWVVGALESAVRGVYQFLVQHQSKAKNREAVNKIVEAYQKDEIDGPWGPLPKEFDRHEQDEIKDLQTGKTLTPEEAVKSTEEWTNKLAFKGEWIRTQLVFEAVRQEIHTDQVRADDMTKVAQQIVKQIVASA